MLAWERARRENAEAPSALVVVAPQVIDADGALLGQASAEPAPEPTKDVPVEVVVDGVVQFAHKSKKAYKVNVVPVEYVEETVEA